MTAGGRESGLQDRGRTTPLEQHRAGAIIPARHRGDCLSQAQVDLEQDALVDRHQFAGRLRLERLQLLGARQLSVEPRQSRPLGSRRRCFD